MVNPNLIPERPREKPAHPGGPGQDVLDILSMTSYRKRIQKSATRTSGKTPDIPDREQGMEGKNKREKGSHL